MVSKDDAFDFRCAWVLAVAEFLEAQGPRDCRGMFVGSIEQLRKAGAKKGARGLRQVSRDLREWALSLNRTLRQELDDKLVADFGLSLEESKAEDITVIAAVVHRGRIDSEEEFRLLEQRVSDLIEAGSRPDEVERINGLLAAFEGSRRME